REVAPFDNLHNRQHITVTANNQKTFENALRDWSNNFAVQPYSYLFGNYSFNYGEDQNGIKTRVSHNFNTVIANDGKLCVNCDELVGKSGNTLTQNASTTSFGVGFVRQCNTQNPLVIEVLDGGKLVFGENSTQYS